MIIKINVISYFRIYNDNYIKVMQDKIMIIKVMKMMMIMATIILKVIMMLIKIMKRLKYLIK